MINWKKRGLGLSDLPISKHKQTEVVDLLHRLQIQEPGIVEQAVLSYVRLALKIASKFAQTNKAYRDDLVAEAMYTLVKACSNHEQILKETDITKYLARTIVTRCRQYLRKQYYKIGSYKSKQMGKYIPQVLSLTTQVQKFPNKPLKYYLLKKEVEEPVDKESKLNELKDLIMSLTDDSLDKAIISLREQGFTDAEIAEKSGYSIKKIYTRRKLIENRFELKEREYNA